MVELYFGAFDIVLYALAFIAAVMISGELCHGIEPSELSTASTAMSSAVTYVSCAPSPQCAAVITVDSADAEASSADSAGSVTVNPAKPVLRVSDVRLYQLHQKSVVPISVLPFSIPHSIKRYILRGQQVVRLESLQEIATVIG